MKLPDTKKIRARYAVSIRGLTAGYDGHKVIEHLDFFLLSGTRTLITGPNGSGKSTLIRAIIESEPGVSITSEASIAYLSQEQDNLDSQKTVLANVTADEAFRNTSAGQFWPICA